MARQGFKKPKVILSYGQGPMIAPGQTLALGLGAGLGLLPPDIKLPPILNADSWAETGAWVSVISSNVAAISYNKDLEQLYVEFLGPKSNPGRTVLYEYYNVPERVAKDMYNCTSLGGFVDQRLKGIYTARQITRMAGIYRFWKYVKDTNTRWDQASFER